VFQHACKMGLEGSLEEAGLALRSFTRLAQVQEPRSAGREAEEDWGALTRERRGSEVELDGALPKFNQLAQSLGLSPPVASANLIALALSSST
jgi:hypothetical protein